MTKPDASIDRRTFVKGAGAVAGVGLVAGCLGDGNGAENGNGTGNGDDDGNDNGNGDGNDNGQETFPTENLTMVIPFGPGGGYDTYARIVGRRLPDYLPNDVGIQMQNVAGAGGRIATEQVYHGDPDGYTHMIVNMVNFGLTQINDDPDYDLRELTYFAQVAEEFRGIAVGVDTDIHTWEEYVEAVQNRDIRFASTGPGSGYVTVPGVIGELGGLYPAENVMERQVVYDGRSEAIQGILGGDAHVMSGSYFSLLPFVQTGDLRMIMACTTEDEPPEQTPDATTLAAEGVENAQEIVDMLATRRMFAGPPGIPEDRATILRAAYAGVINDADFLAEAEAQDRPIIYADHEVSADAVAGFIDGWSDRQDLLNVLYGQ